MSDEPTEQEIDRDLAFAVHAAREAGRRVFGLRATRRWEEPKMVADIGDQAADGYLQGLLQGRYPEDGILSEETADTPDRLQRARCWIVDPLDGTREFGQGRHDWAVHVALTWRGAPALAAVALPTSGAVLWGVALPGRERAGIDGADIDDELVHGSSPAPTPPRIAVSRSHTPPWTPSFAELLDGGELVPAGSAGYKVMMLLRDEADVYVHKRGLKEWDTCAPETVARAMGWSVCKLRGEQHRYNQPDPRNHELVVCRPAMTDRVLASLAESGALDPD